MRVLIADDSVLLREGLALILADGGHEVVGGVGDGETLVSEALRLRPDVVVADIRMPPSHTDEGLRATTRIRAQWRALVDADLPSAATAAGPSLRSRPSTV